MNMPATDLHPLHPPETPEQLPSCQMSHIHTCQKMARRYRAYTDQCRRNRDAESWCPKRNLHAKNTKPLIILSQHDRSPSPRVPLSSRRGLSTTNFLTIMLAVNFREMDVETKRRIFNFGASQSAFGADALSFSDCNLRISKITHYRCTQPLSNLLDPYYFRPERGNLELLNPLNPGRSGDRAITLASFWSTRRAAPLFFLRSSYCVHRTKAGSDN